MLRKALLEADMQAYCIIQEKSSGAAAILRQVLKPVAEIAREDKTVKACIKRLRPKILGFET